VRCAASQSAPSPICIFLACWSTAVSTERRSWRCVPRCSIIPQRGGAQHARTCSKNLGLLDDALNAYRRALELKPEYYTGTATWSICSRSIRLRPGAAAGRRAGWDRQPLKRRPQQPSRTQISGPGAAPARGLRLARLSYHCQLLFMLPLLRQSRSAAVSDLLLLGRSEPDSDRAVCARSSTRGGTSPRSATSRPRR